MVVAYVTIGWPWDLEGQVKGKDLVHMQDVWGIYFQEWSVIFRRGVSQERGVLIR